MPQMSENVAFWYFTMLVGFKCCNSIMSVHSKLGTCVYILSLYVTQYIGTLTQLLNPF